MIPLLTQARFNTDFENEKARFLLICGQGFSSIFKDRFKRE
jgi:hypothetical protein